MKSKWRSPEIWSIFHHVFLIAFSLIALFPVVWLFSTSLKPDSQIFIFPPTLIPRPIRWDNYSRMVSYLPFFRFMGNTVYVTALGLIGNLLSSSMAAYAFARLEWRGRDLFFAALLGTIMLPAQVTMIPVYMIFSKLGWVNTLKPLWVPAFFGNAFYVFLLRQFFLTIPVELEEAAKMDGCSYLRIFWQILLPVVKPALATIAIFSFIAHWNNFMGPLIYLNDVDIMTISIGLRLFQQTYAGEWSLMMAASTLATLPIIIVFFTFQKQFIEGIVMTGMKG